MALDSAQRIPRATYRVQLHPGFTFADLERRIPFLAKLGISDCYCSPILQSTPGSTHGYDVADYRHLNPELGGEKAFVACSEALSREGMGVLVDFVPNHMGISGPLNAWWMNVLENGPHSPYAKFFDVHWRTSDMGGRSHILVPILEDHYGVVLEKGSMKLAYHDGSLRVAYGGTQLPLNAAAYAALLARLAADSEVPEKSRPELDKLLRAFHRLAPAAIAWAANPEVPEQQHALKHRFAKVVAKHAALAARVDVHLKALSGEPGTAGSFDALDAILMAQSFRLARWKTGIYAINYRRFFAVDTLVGLRMENPEVFTESHALLGMLIKEGKITGLRIDHIDGLWDPRQYLEQLQALRPTPPEGQPDAPLYVVVEKILERGEDLNPVWAAHGTTGYEFITACAGLLTRASASDEFDRIYREFTGETVAYGDLVYEKKRLILSEMFINTLTELTGGLVTLLVADRHWRDLTRAEVAMALREIAACFPVYRTYRRLGEAASEADKRWVDKAYVEAVRRNPRFDVTTMGIVRDVLTGAYPPPGSPEERRNQIARWVLSFQQYTGAIMAKSVEDTAFYLYNRLIALNEVGGDPAEFGLSIEEFHATNRERRRQTPHSLIASSTHDSKLSEDVRARLYVLSEIPHEWRAWLNEWRGLNAAHKTRLDGHEAPDANEEYRLYQAILGAWPIGAESADDAFRERIRGYFRKAVNEAKLNTTWTEPNEAWLTAGDKFIDRILSPETGDAFLASFVPKAARIAHCGMVNSLVQLAVKLTCPGVPDFYQGNEVWDFSLVDPDNRRPVDFDAHERLLAEIDGKEPRELLFHWQDGGIKLRLTRDLLQFRKEHAALFAEGDYEPVELAGAHAAQAVAFRRQHGADRMVVVLARQTAKVGCPPVGLVWAETAIALGGDWAEGGEWRDVVTGRTFPAAPSLPLAELLRQLPVAVLHRTS